MVERPILFNGEMVQAILAGRKTQTRRMMNPQPKMVGTILDWHGFSVASGDRPGPFGQYVPGDLLWVRETWADPSGAQIPIYRADNATAYENIKWRPSIHMPRWASRISLTITDVLVEQVQDISEQDALAEGFPCGEWVQETICGVNHSACGLQAIEWLAGLWDSIAARHGYPWESNPWVWAVTFEVVR